MSSPNSQRGLPIPPSSSPPSSSPTAKGTSLTPTSTSTLAGAAPNTPSVEDLLRQINLLEAALTNAALRVTELERWKAEVCAANPVEPAQISPERRVRELSLHKILRTEDFPTLRLKLEIDPESIHELNSLQQTPLCAECARPTPSLAVITALISAGSNPNLTDTQQLTPLHYLGNLTPPSVTSRRSKQARLETYKVIQYLVETGKASPKILDSDGQSVLHLLSRHPIHRDSPPPSPHAGSGPSHRDLYKEFQKTLMILLAPPLGVDINIATIHGATPLHIAASAGQLDILQLLLELRADLRLCTHKGSTVLHCAIRAQHRAMVATLLDLGLDPRTEQKAGSSALELAKEFGSKGKPIYDLLKAKASLLDMKGMSEQQKKIYRRKLGIEEIMVTEKDYLDDLKVLMKVYVTPLQKMIQSPDSDKNSILTQGQFDKLFGNIDSIVEISYFFWVDLVNACKDLKFVTQSQPRSRASKAIGANENEGPEYPDPPLGAIFRKHIPEFERYEPFCTNQFGADRLLKKLLSENTGLKRVQGHLIAEKEKYEQNFSTINNVVVGVALDAVPEKSELNVTFGEIENLNSLSKFAQFCADAKANPECRQLDLASFLIKPFQRITKYPLLIREVLNSLDESHPDREALETAQAQINRIISFANEKKRTRDEIRILKQIQKGLVFPTISPPTDADSVKRSVEQILAEMGKTGPTRPPLQVEKTRVDLVDGTVRKLIAQGRVPMSINRDKFQKRVFHVFSDLLLITRPLSGYNQSSSFSTNTVAAPEILEFVLSIPMLLCVLWDLPDGSMEGNKAVKNAIAVMVAQGNDKWRIVFRAKTPNMKSHMMSVITKQIKDCGGSVQEDLEALLLVNRQLTLIQGVNTGERDPKFVVDLEPDPPAGAESEKGLAASMRSNVGKLNLKGLSARLSRRIEKKDIIIKESENKKKDTTSKESENKKKDTTSKESENKKTNEKDTTSSESENKGTVKWKHRRVGLPTGTPPPDLGHAKKEM